MHHRQLAAYLPLFEWTYEVMASDVGWVRGFIVGGIDKHGKIKAIQYVLLDASLSIY